MTGNNNLVMGGINVIESTSLVTVIDLSQLTPPDKKKRNTTYKPLVWNVFYEDFNERKIVTYNIFKHAGFYEDCFKAAKKYKDDKEQFAKSVKRSLMYYYWSKCEWEIILTAWPPCSDFHDEKIDVYDQVRLNWDQFIDYLWENKGVLHAS